jgi:hypothetical protein
MGGSASRIWSEICAIDSNHVRAQMIERLASSPDVLITANRAGVYEPVMDWLLAYRRGEMRQFPFSSQAQARDTIQHQGIHGGKTPIVDMGNTHIQHDTPRWSMYTTPVTAEAHATRGTPSPARPLPSQSAMIVSPAAKALDYFQESLQLLGIDENESLTYERLKQGYKRASLRAHPDKGGSKEAFDEVRRAFQYVEKILNRINPKFSAADTARMSAPVTLESATAYRDTSNVARIDDAPPVALSAKKLDMGMFNKLFEENRLPDNSRDKGYGDWLKSGSGSDEIAVDPRLAGKKFTPQNFESVFRERALQQTPSTAIQKRLEPDAIMPTGGYELGADNRNFSAGFGSDVQFTDLQEAYTTGSTMFQEVADVRVGDRRGGSVRQLQADRDKAFKRADPDEASRIAAAAAALEERERQRRLRLAQQDTAAESWSETLRRRLLVNK